MRRLRVVIVGDEARAAAIVAGLRERAPDMVSDVVAPDQDAPPRPRGRRASDAPEADALIAIVGPGGLLPHVAPHAGTAPVIALTDAARSQNDTAAAGLIAQGAYSVVTWGHWKLLEAQVRTYAQRARERLRVRAVIDQLDEGLVLVGASGQTLLANDKATELLGHPGRRASDPDDDWRLVDEAGTPVDPSEYPLFRALRDGQEHEAILGARGTDGQQRWLRVRATPFGESDTVVGAGVLVSLFDVSDRRAAEKNAESLKHQLEHSQRLQELGTMAGGIAHDFNNILAPICGYADLMAGGLKRDDPLASDLEHIRKGAERARELVAQILAFSGQGESKPRFEDPVPIVTEAVKLMRATLPSTIKIRIETEDDCGTIFADPVQIHQTVVNLCSNAGRAMEDGGGLLCVSLDCVEIQDGEEGLDAGPHVRLRVEDTGCGMDDETQRRIFEPFFSTRSRDQGTGLGLSVVHGIVKQHGGAIRIRSVPGEGTTCELLFPRSEEPIQAPEPTSTADPRGTERVLVVDDEEHVGTVFSRVLGALGYRVRTATNGPHAVSIVRTDPGAFDAIVTDFTMPRMTGDILAQELRQIRPDLPIVMVTGYYRGLTPEVLQRAGIDEVLSKPVAGDELARAIRRAVDSKRMPPQRPARAKAPVPTS